MAEMTWVTVTPKVERLAFSIRVPEHFHQLPLPGEEQDFSNPSAMMPCGVFMAEYAVVVCTVAARPAFDDGTVMDWAMYLVGQQEGMKVTKLMPERRWGTQVVEVEATQPSEAGEMTVRAIFFEDGGRLFNVGRMAPTAIWPSVKDTLEAMVESFSLLHVDGPTKPLAQGAALPEKAQFSAVRNDTPAVPAPVEAPAAAPEVKPEEEQAPALGVFALEDAAALDRDDDINARFREVGAGLVPNVLAREEAAKTVTVGVGALEAAMTIPAGWHVVDDGRRVLVFDRGNRIQVNFNLFTIEGQSPSEIFTEINGELLKEHPGAEHRVFEAGGMNVMQVRGLVIDGEPLQQAYLLRRLGENVGLKVRVTAPEEDLARGAEMAIAIVRALRPLGQSQQ